MKICSWFSAGVSSAVATYLALKKYPDLKILYIHIDNQHIDSLRFLHDCEIWFNKKIEILSSPYRNIHNVITSQRYINGPTGAPCTRILKKRVRQEWEINNLYDAYVWGMDYSKREINRAERIISSMPNINHVFPLQDEQINKANAHGILKNAGIKRPAMYELGYPNNNCVGCVKGGRGYWNKIKKDFPDVFTQMLRDEISIGASCIKGTFLKDLKEDTGHNLKVIIEDCGIFCEAVSGNSKSN